MKSDQTSFFIVKKRSLSCQSRETIKVEDIVGVYLYTSKKSSDFFMENRAGSCFPWMYWDRLVGTKSQINSGNGCVSHHPQNQRRHER